MARSKRRVWLMAAGATIVGSALLFLWLAPPPRPPRTISDERFAAQAADLCRETIPRYRADPGQNRREERNETATAARIERAADALDAMVDDIAALDVQPQDRDEVARWISAWREFVEHGRRYADAVRSEDADAFSARAEESRESVLRVGRFARANHIDDCIPR